MISLKRLVSLQFLYAFLGIMFNVVSIWHFKKNGSYLTPNIPTIGIVVMTTYAVFLISSRFKNITIYRFLMAFSVLLLGYGGVLQHIINVLNSEGQYHSLLVGLIGFSINLYGLILNIIAALKKFEQ